MITKKDWSEFKDTGLLMFINQILHVFGWSIVFEMVENNVTDVYPARVKFRGFDNETVSKSYIKISEYLNENIGEILKESKDKGELK